MLTAFRDLRLLTAEDFSIMAKTVWAEARGETFPGQIAVAWVIRNRAEHPGWWGKTLREVCTKESRGVYQFSCWHPKDPNYHAMLLANYPDPAYVRALGICQLVLSGDFPDLTHGATNYLTKAAALTTSWDDKMQQLAVIGQHIFLKEK